MITNQFVLLAFGLTICLIVMTVLIKLHDYARIIHHGPLTPQEQDRLFLRDAEFNDIVYESKPMPNTIRCECGTLMDYISIDLGYSCRNPECALHIDESFPKVTASEQEFFEMVAETGY